MKARVKVRHVGGDVGAFVKAETPQTSESASEIKITFSTPHKAVAPGQIVVVYDENGEWCLGCGVIEDTKTMDLG